MTNDQKPSNQEDEYFVREDQERLRKLHAEEQSRMQQGERDALRKAHAGRCSGCGATMVPEKAGEVTILHCPACGGAFLEKRAWDFMHGHDDSHSVMSSVLNWFRAANKP